MTAKPTLGERIWAELCSEDNWVENITGDDIINKPIMLKAILAAVDQYDANVKKIMEKQ